MNLEDIAKRAGVSRSTVSRVVNGQEYVSERTRRKVLAVIDEVGFSPNPAGRMLVTQRTQVIGIVIPYPLQYVFSGDDPYYYNTVLQTITDVSYSRDYATLLWVGNAQEEDHLFYQRILKNRLMDGLVIVASVTGEEPLVDQLLKNGTPFSMVGTPMSSADQINYSTIDNVAAAEQAVSHLISVGRRKIAIITGEIDNIDAQERLIGYENALRNAEIPIDPALIVKAYFTRTSGYREMKQLLDKDIDALFASSDLIGIGAINAIQEAGLRVPEDIAVVGFDDFPVASQATPPLTTIRQPIVKKTALATEILLDILDGEVTGPKQVILPTQLVIRQSCGYEM